MPDDYHDLATSHVIPALIRKAHEAKLRGDASMTIRGASFCTSTTARTRSYTSSRRTRRRSHVGSGKDLTILELARLVCDVVGFEGEIVCDPSKPDGTPRKLMSGVKLAALGWRPTIPLREGLADAYRGFLGEPDEARSNASWA